MAKVLPLQTFPDTNEARLQQFFEETNFKQYAYDKRLCIHNYILKILHLIKIFDEIDNDHVKEWESENGSILYNYEKYIEEHPERSPFFIQVGSYSYNFLHDNPRPNHRGIDIIMDPDFDLESYIDIT